MKSGNLHLPFRLTGGFQGLEKGKAGRYAQELNFARKHLQETKEEFRHLVWAVRSCPSLSREGLFDLELFLPEPRRMNSELQEMAFDLVMDLAGLANTSPALAGEALSSFPSPEQFAEAQAGQVHLQGAGQEASPATPLSLPAGEDPQVAWMRKMYGEDIPL
jgi:hypothetical protein